MWWDPRPPPPPPAPPAVPVGEKAEGVVVRLAVRDREMEMAAERVFEGAGVNVVVGEGEGVVFSFSEDEVDALRVKEGEPVP